MQATGCTMRWWKVTDHPMRRVHQGYALDWEVHCGWWRWRTIWPRPCCINLGSFQIPTQGNFIPRPTTLKSLNIADLVLGRHHRRATICDHCWRSGDGHKFHDPISNSGGCLLDGTVWTQMSSQNIDYRYVCTFIDLPLQSPPPLLQ